MLIEAVILVLLEVSQSLASKYNCTSNPVTNGCNVWSIVMYKDIFAPDCHRHDVCYSCGTKVDLSRDLCDNIFYNDLLDTCATDKRAGWACYGWARTYYWSVKTFGALYYQDEADDWCNSVEYGYNPCLTD